jgi:hypothetical protein
MLVTHTSHLYAWCNKCAQYAHIFETMLYFSEHACFETFFTSALVHEHAKVSDTSMAAVFFSGHSLCASVAHYTHYSLRSKFTLRCH